MEDRLFLLSQVALPQLESVLLLFSRRFLKPTNKKHNGAEGLKILEMVMNSLRNHSLENEGKSFDGTHILELSTKAVLFNKCYKSSKVIFFC